MSEGDSWSCQSLVSQYQPRCPYIMSRKGPYGYSDQSAEGTFAVVQQGGYGGGGHSGYGSHSGGGSCTVQSTGLCEALLVAAGLAVAVAAFGALALAITMGKRKRRSVGGIIDGLRHINIFEEGIKLTKANH